MCVRACSLGWACMLVPEQPGTRDIHVAQLSLLCLLLAHGCNRAVSVDTNMYAVFG